MHTTHAIIFTRDEMVYVESLTRPSEVSIAQESNLLPSSTPSKELFLKIGSCLLDMLEKGQPVALVLTEQECLAIREAASPYAMKGQEPVGLNVLKIIYTLLLAFDEERQMPELPSVREHQDPSKQEVTDALQRRTDEDNAQNKAKDNPSAKPRKKA